jgi:hypothetical protein
MKRPRDPELERFERTIDLVEYAKRAGYEPWPNDGACGLSVLDHPRGDRIVVARSPDGPWIYASVADYAPSTPGEPAEHALARLRHCIAGSTDKGSVVEFVQQRDAGLGRVEVSLERVRDRLRAFRATGAPLEFDGSLRRLPAPGRLERASDRARDGVHPPGVAVAREDIARRSKPELNQRRYDWSPPVPNAPPETEVERRLRRWREAQPAIDVRTGTARERAATHPLAPAAVPAPGRDRREPSPPGLLRAERSESLGPRNKSELNRRRYDWTPAPPSVDALLRGLRKRSPDRDR